jgi:hypothetical protein
MKTAQHSTRADLLLVLVHFFGQKRISSCKISHVFVIDKLILKGNKTSPQQGSHSIFLLLFNHVHDDDIESPT